MSDTHRRHQGNRDMLIQHGSINAQWGRQGLARGGYVTAHGASQLHRISTPQGPLGWLLYRPWQCLDYSPSNSIRAVGLLLIITIKMLLWFSFSHCICNHGPMFFFYLCSCHAQMSLLFCNTLQPRTDYRKCDLCAGKRLLFRDEKCSRRKNPCRHKRKLFTISCRCLLMYQ